MYVVIFAGTGLELVTAMDRVLVALTNLIYLMDNYPGEQKNNFIMYIDWHRCNQIFRR
jgi:hypothetical protein